MCDGVDALLAAAQEVEQEEEDLLRLIQDPWENRLYRVVCFHIQVALTCIK